MNEFTISFKVVECDLISNYLNFSHLPESVLRFKTFFKSYTNQFNGKSQHLTNIFKKQVY
jgi:hypothetical protein